MCLELGSDITARVARMCVQQANGSTLPVTVGGDVIPVTLMMSLPVAVGAMVTPQAALASHEPAPNPGGVAQGRPLGVDL